MNQLREIWAGLGHGLGGLAGHLRVRGRARDLRDRTWGRLGPRGRWRVAAVLAGLAALGAGAALGSWKHICDDCPSVAQIYAFEPKEATRVYAADGSLLHEFAIERRTAIEYAELPEFVTDAFVSIEDRRFWSHHGIDYLRTVRAALELAFGGYGGAGGSTITQQLAGNMFAGVVDRRDISVRRKLREMKVSKSLEAALTKKEILGAYLNQINFDGVYGIQNAAQRYFGKDAADLNLPEAALLAGLPRAPARYSPVKHPERAVQRRNLVLSLMARQDRISDEDAVTAMAYPLLLNPGAGSEPLARYFVEWVRRILIERYGTRIYEAGLRVFTTLDPEFQATADSALEAQLQWIEKQPGFQAPTYQETRDWDEGELDGTVPYLQGMFIAVDPETGDVLAMVGGRDFDDSEFNRATQAVRQPGSSFKPIVYAAAIASGMPASEVIFDSPLEFVQADGSIWSPRNFSGTFRGPITLREALTRSVNVVAVKVALRIGIETAAQFAHRMGITTEVPPFPSTAIGAAAVRPIELVQVYTTFANLGVRVTPRPILRIENAEGEVLWESTVDREEVLDENTSWIMVSMMRDVVDHGSGIAIRRGGVPYDVPVAGKTGTTNETTNAWFMGFTPNLVTATWVGFDRPARIRTDAQGGVDAAPVNAAALKWYYEHHPVPPEWPRPAGLITRRVDRLTGQLASEWCPADEVYEEYYVPGTEPRTLCEMHGPFGARVLEDSLPGDSIGLSVGDDFDF